MLADRGYADDYLSPINLAGKLSAFSEYWSPRVVAEMNDYQFKVVKLKGEFVWQNSRYAPWGPLGSAPSDGPLLPLRQKADHARQAAAYCARAIGRQG